MDWMMWALVAGVCVMSVLFAVIGLGVCAVTITKTWASVLKPVRIASVMRLMCVVFALIGLFLCALAIPYAGKEIIGDHPTDYAKYFWPWLTFAWLAAAPCFGVLACVWLAAGNVRRETVFSVPMARTVGAGALLMTGDGVFVLIGNFVMGALGLGQPGFTLMIVLVAFVMIALGTLAGALSHYLRKAAALQDDSEGLL